MTPVALEIARFGNEGVEDWLAGFRKDGAVVFDGLPDSGFNAVLPTWAVTFVCPSGPIDALRDTTALWPGSQLANEEPDAPAFVAPEVLPGCCALWDFRTWHRGLENRSDEARPLLYAVASRPLWIYHEDYQLGVVDNLSINPVALDGFADLARNRFVRAKVVQ